MLSSTTDIELWDAAVQGNRKAFNILFCRHYPLLYQFGCKICLHTETVEDSIQELFIEIWQKKNPPPERSVKAYLLQALKFKLYKTFRSERKLLPLTESSHDAFELSHETFLIHAEEDAEKAKRVLDAINQLPPRQKEIIYFKVYKNLSYDEVCEVMELNYQAVRNLLYQALKTFRKLVAYQQP